MNANLREKLMEYAEADFSKRYVGYFEISQEDAKDLALHVLKLEQQLEDALDEIKNMQERG